MRVALEPARPGDMPALAEGLRLLNRADPFVEVGLTDKGEQLLGAAGEVHLETCVKDLRERFARVDFHVSPPLVAFRESVACPAEEAADGGAAAAAAARPARVVEAATPGGACVVRVRAHALPGALAAALDDGAALLKQVVDAATAAAEGGGGDVGAAVSAAEAAGGAALAALRQRVAGACRDAANGKQLLRLLRRAWLLGPKRIGPNMLLASGGSSSSSSGSGSSLFDAPPALVVKCSRQTAGAGKALAPISSTAAAGGAAAGGGAAAQAAGGAAPLGEADAADGAVAAAAEATVPVPLGDDRAAGLLGFAADPAAAAGDGDGLASQLAQLGRGDDAASDTSSRPPSRAGPPLAAASAGTGADTEAAAAAEAASNWHHVRSSVESGAVAGFSLAAAAGPLMDEPLWGVAFELEVRVRPPAGGAANGGSANGGDNGGAGGASASSGSVSFDLQEDVYGPFSGQVMAAAAAACRQAVAEADARLVEAHFLCQVQAAAEALAGVYAALGRRRARVLREELREGSGAFAVHAYLPVEASFGLADELRRRSSGAASASLLLSHWARLPVDPFFVPTTEEELEEFGSEAGGPANLARRLVDAVRRRKGLPVEEKVVKVATKQRTLKRNV